MDDTLKRKKKFYSSYDYRKSDIIIVSTRFRESQHCKRNRETLNTFAGLRALIERVLNDGKKIIVFSSNVEFHSHQRRTLLDHRLSELADRVGGVENIGIDEFNALVGFYLKKFILMQRRGLRNLTIKVKNIADDFDVPYVDKYQLICSDYKESCIVLTPSGEKVFGMLAIILKMAQST